MAQRYLTHTSNVMVWNAQDPRFQDAEEATCEMTGHTYVKVGNDVAVLLNGESKMINIPLVGDETPKEAAEYHRNKWMQDNKHW